MNRILVRRHTAMVCFFAAYVYICQILPLTWGRPLTLDMINHTWMVEYYSNFFKNHWIFPGTFDTEQVFGNPMPIFYGVFFYPVLSLIAIATGADLAVRLSAGAVLFAPLITISYLVNSSGIRWKTSLLISCVVNASVYQMTNIYQRGALAEFFALQFLIIGISITLYGLRCLHKKYASIVLLGFSFITLALGTHPITVYSCAIFLVPLSVMSIPVLLAKLPRRNCYAAFGGATICLVAIMPWVVVVWTNQHDLQISVSAALNTLFFFPTSIDSFWGRMGYFYFDTRVAIDGIAKTSTPFLDAPYSLPMALILMLVLLKRFSRRISELSLIVVPSLIVIFALLYAGYPSERLTTPGGFAGSVVASASDGFIYRLLLPLQFAYRLAGAWFVSIAFALFLSLLCVPGRGSYFNQGFFRRAVLLSSILSAFAMTQKLYVTNLGFRIFPGLSIPGPQSEPSWTALVMDRTSYLSIVANSQKYPFSFQTQVSYSTPGELPLSSPSSPSDVYLQVLKWGDQPPVYSPVDFVLRTNVAPAPTNKIMIDGVQASATGLSSTGTLDFSVTAGTHEVTVERVGRRFDLIQASIFLMLGMFIFALIGFCAPTLRPNWPRGLFKK